MTESLPPEPADRSVASPNARPRSLWPMAFAVVAVAVLLMVSLAAWWVSRGIAGVGSAAVERAAETVRAAVTPTVVRREVMNIILERPDRTPKLVVMTEPVRVVVARTDELRWLYLYWGTNSTRLELAGNRVQWVVDLSKIDDRHVVVDEVTKTVTLMVPPPRIDREMVVVQTDPQYVREETERGWARLPASAQTLAEDARKRIVPTILEAADNADSRAEAARAAKESVETVMSPVLGPYLREHDYTLRIEIGEPEGE